MKTRVTFRVSPDLADALRALPNQTTFVERALRQALQQPCPLCRGTGHVDRVGLGVSDFREARLPRLERRAALQLRSIVRLGKRAAATRLDLSREGPTSIAFQLERGDEVLLRGSLARESAEVSFN